MNYFNHFWTIRPIWMTILAFVVPITLLIDYSPDMEKQSKCAYGILVMAILWVTEAIPIPVTALMPIFMFPMLGVETAKEISKVYISDTSMLFFGGLVIAVALEESGLHKRISLIVLRVVGAKPVWLMLGLMVTTWFLSMWISNTAASSMMLPIISAVLETVREVRRGASGGEVNEAYDMDDMYVNGEVTVDKVDSKQSSSNKYEVTSPTGSKKEDDPEIMRLAKAFAISVAYGANVGGIATLTGTPPNLVLKEEVDKLYAEKSGDPNMESEISFANWMAFAFPMSLIALILCWGWLQLLFLRCGCCTKMDPQQSKAINATIVKQYRALGRMTMAEIQVLLVFVSLVGLWLSRSPPNSDGWGVAFKDGSKSYASDSTPCILFSVLLFILPKEVPKVFCWAEGERPSYKPILTWSAVNTKLAWGVIVLLGGGFALAKASRSSGLSKWIGEELEVFADADTWVMNLIICVVVASMTELTSNTATATLLMPILSALAISIEVHPLYMMISAAIACSFAFMLPVATPPNAIVFSTGYLRVTDMVIAGLPMNIIAILCLTLAINTWGKAMYDMDDIPPYFRHAATTLAPNVTTLSMNTTTAAMLTTTMPP